ncbi:UbiH/UbiF/VisC/COQ6 family ubiquinone biosynthesis hydroxylase [Moraxella macacae 0408225]|uniref:UbiH/UbiF/VisC/COQ6 family ubiquinone biosynthesis hydroxylase n=1 Tax=Moraxella macacae 0408225 TaxID=1230338 RepID=L2F852_9GAMM|nr:FAD-dependent monooxygenase [Moraxella macacae]ELA08961.1 UbiH/UbiF/VisC/COQ6 family ubiquinone biosynthesis hydroxylase [Moraxella macacae 0408225]
MTNQKIIIVGGGNVGLSFALLLAYRGIRSTLLEQNHYPSISPDDDKAHIHYLDSRNMALSRRTVQIYQQIGMWHALKQHACRIDGVKISEQGGFGKAYLDKHEEKVESFGYVIENSWLGRKLLLAVQNSPLIELLDAATVTNIQQTEQNVTVSFEKNNKKQSLTADLLVACDGQNSLSRQLLGVNSSFYDYGQMGVVGTVISDRPHKHIAIERFSPKGLVAVLPLCDGCDEKGNTRYRRSVVWVCDKGDERRYLDDDAYFLAALQNTFGSQAGAFVTAGRRTAYPLVKVLAEHQVVGRCVIMGNSAHTLHPVAGQGFNLCMRDADTLATMLAKQALRGDDIGANALLKNYAKRRKADQKRVILFCDGVVYSFTHSSPLVKLVRNVGLIAFDKIPFVKPMVATFAMGLKS